jgi:hypothetical protein
VYLTLAPLAVWVADLFYAVPLVAALVAMAGVLRAPAAAHRRFWRWAAPGVILICTGDLLWMVFELVHWEPTPSPTAPCYVVGGVLVAVAMLRGGHGWTLLRSLRTFIDASVLAAAVLTIGGAVFVAPAAAGELDVDLVAALAYNGFGVIALVPALFLCLTPGRVPVPILLGALALVGRMGSDGLYTWLLATGAYHSGHPDPPPVDG